MNIYILEYRRDKSLLSNIISSVTKTNYSHTAGFIADKWFAELDAINPKGVKDEPDYHVYEFNSIYDFLVNSPDGKRVDAFEIPFDFSKEQIDSALNWWKIKEFENVRYGYAKLAAMSFTVPFQRFWKRLTGKPYHPILFNDLDVCSCAWDECLRYIGYDIFADMDEHSAYPGLFAEKLKDFKVNT